MSDKTTGVLVQHQAALAEGRFLIQKCDGCGQHIYFPREICPHCGSDAVQFVSPSGQGTVYAVTTVRRKPADGGDYNVSLIDLDEGPRLMSRVDNLKPDDVKIGQHVTARVVVAEDKGVVVFDAVGGAA
ncbi:COG1545 Predicted nucleic-acid-binding protein containing a Zn-ribbon [Burkholderiaceae bacterium]